MPEQSKFENVDLFASLEAIMKQNTGFYQSDFDRMLLETDEVQKLPDRKLTAEIIDVSAEEDGEQ